MKLEDLKVGAIIMRADRKENPLHSGEMLLVTRFISVKPKFEVVCLHSEVTDRIGETGIILFGELPDYELITALCVQSQNNSPFLQSKPTEPKKDLYLRWTFGKKTSLGKVGDKSPYRTENGRNLVVGDVVTIKNDDMKETGCLVVCDEDDGYYIMGIANDCNSKTGEIKNFQVSLERGYKTLKKGYTFDIGFCRGGIEVVDFVPDIRAEEKE